MPWTKSDYPDAFKNMPETVRNKAVEITNKLLEEDHMDEGMAIATAITRARDWAENKTTQHETPSPLHMEINHHSNDRYVLPYKDSKWAVKRKGEQGVGEVFDLKSDAVAAARRQAKDDNAILTIQLRNGRVAKRVSYQKKWA